MDDLARRVVGAGIVALVALVEVLEHPAEHLRVGVDRLIVRGGLARGEAVARKQPENAVLLVRVKHVVGQGDLAAAFDTIFEGVRPEQPTVEVRSVLQQLLDLPAAVALGHGFEEERHEETAIEAPLNAVPPLPQPAQVAGPATAGAAAAEPTFGLQEPEEQDAAELAGCPGAPVVPGERAHRRVLRVRVQKGLREAVPDACVLKIKPLGHALDAKRLPPLPGDGRERRGGGDHELLKQLSVKAVRFTDVDERADCRNRAAARPTIRPLGSSRKHHLNFRPRGPLKLVRDQEEQHPAVGHVLDERPRHAAPRPVTVRRSLAPIVQHRHVEGRAAGVGRAMGHAVELADTEAIRPLEEEAAKRGEAVEEVGGRAHWLEADDPGERISSARIASERLERVGDLAQVRHAVPHVCPA